MPIFEYHCTDCDTKFEALVMSTAAEPDACDCGSGSIEKVYSTFAAHADSAAPQACATPADCGTPVCGGGMCGVN